MNATMPTAPVPADVKENGLWNGVVALTGEVAPKAWPMARLVLWSTESYALDMWHRHCEANQTDDANIIELQSLGRHFHQRLVVGARQLKQVAGHERSQLKSQLLWHERQKQQCHNEIERLRQQATVLMAPQFSAKRFCVSPECLVHGHQTIDLVPTVAKRFPVEQRGMTGLTLLRRLGAAGLRQFGIEAVLIDEVRNQWRGEWQLLML